MDSCDAVERELDKVTAKFGNVCQDSIDRLDEIINKLKSVQNRWRKFLICDDIMIVKYWKLLRAKIIFLCL